MFDLEIGDELRRARVAINEVFRKKKRMLMENVEPYESVNERDVVTWTSTILTGLASDGFVDESLAMFNPMVLKLE